MGKTGGSRDGREKTPPQDSQESTTSSNDSPDSKFSGTSEPDLGLCVSEWNRCWDTVLRRFNITRVESRIDSCLEKVEEIRDVPLHFIVEGMVTFVSKNLDIDMDTNALFEWRDMRNTQTRRTMKQNIKLCQERLWKQPLVDLAVMRSLTFLEEIKRFLNICEPSLYVEGAALSLFQTFASLACLEFRPGSAIKRETRLGAVDQNVFTSIPDLRAFVPISLDDEEWDLCDPAVLAVAEVKPTRSLETVKGSPRHLRSGDVPETIAFKKSERLLGQLVGEMLAEYKSSAFRKEGKVIGFGVQGSEVQLFILEMSEDTYFLDKGFKDIRKGAGTILSVSSPYDMLRWEDRNTLLQVMGKLASYRMGC